MKLFECIVDDGKDVFKTLTAAKGRKALLDEYGGNGEFLKIKDVTAEYFTEQSVDLLDQHLQRMGWGEGERKILCALLEMHLVSQKKM